MFCKTSLPGLLLLLGCAACGAGSEEAESEPVGSPPTEASAEEPLGEQADPLAEHTPENDLSSSGCEDAEITGEAEQETTEGPVTGNPWGDGGPDAHTYSGGPGGRSPGGYADPRNYHRGSSAADIEREREVCRRYTRGQRKLRQMKKEFARHRMDILTDSRKRIGRGWSVDHEACVWMCDQSIAGSCESIQALCTSSPVIILSPHATISCGAAIFVACILGQVSSPVVCDDIVCAGVR